MLTGYVFSKYVNLHYDYIMKNKSHPKHCNFVMKERQL